MPQLSDFGQPYGVYCGLSPMTDSSPAILRGRKAPLRVGDKPSSELFHVNPMAFIAGNHGFAGHGAYDKGSVNDSLKSVFQSLSLYSPSSNTCMRNV